MNAQKVYQKSFYHKTFEVNFPFTSKDSLDDFQPSFPQRNHNFAIAILFSGTQFNHNTPSACQLLK